MTPSSLISSHDVSYSLLKSSLFSLPHRLKQGGAKFTSVSSYTGQGLESHHDSSQVPDFTLLLWHSAGWADAGRKAPSPFSRCQQSRKSRLAEVLALVFALQIPFSPCSV